MASTGSQLRWRAMSATERWVPCTLSITKSRSKTAGRGSAPRGGVSNLARAASTSFGRRAGSRNFAFCSASGRVRISVQTGSRSKGSAVRKDSSAESARLWTWANIRPPAAAVSSSRLTYSL